MSESQRYGAYLDFTRAPESSERKAATALARKLRQVKHPAVKPTRRNHTRPPGQLDVREAMRLTHQVSANQRITAKPFIHTAVDRTKTADLKVGIMCDISGSMSSAQEPLAVSRWVLADAVHAVGGEVATVLFGDDAHGVQRGKQRQTEIEVFDARGGWENYIPAFSMIDGELDLIDGDGARLLVIITDGRFNDRGAVRYAEETMDMARKAGVVVVWLSVSGYFQREDGYGHGKVIDGHGKSATEIATMLGNEVLDAFRDALR